MSVSRLFASHICKCIVSDFSAPFIAYSKLYVRISSFAQLWITWGITWRPLKLTWKLHGLHLGINWEIFQQHLELCTMHCTLHYIYYALHYVLLNTVQYAIHFTHHYALHYALHCTLHYSMHNQCHGFVIDDRKNIARISNAVPGINLL